MSKYLANNLNSDLCLIYFCLMIVNDYLKLFLQYTFSLNSSAGILLPRDNLYRGNKIATRSYLTSGAKNVKGSFSVFTAV